MDAQLSGRTAARHLSQIQEESDSREHSTCVLPPVVRQQAGRADGPGEVRRASRPAAPVLYGQQRKLEDDGSLLEELGRIEAELRLDVEQRQETESLRQKTNKQLLQSLLHLSLSQRVNKPWVSSYFRVFPMHIYCLPVQTVSHKGRRRGLNRRR